MGLISVRGGTLFSCLNKNATDLPLTPFPSPPPGLKADGKKLLILWLCVIYGIVQYMYFLYMRYKMLSI
jgi:hypothetical protein